MIALISEYLWKEVHTQLHHSNSLANQPPQSLDMNYRSPSPSLSDYLSSTEREIQGTSAVRLFGCFPFLSMRLRSLGNSE